MITIARNSKGDINIIDAMIAMSIAVGVFIMFIRVKELGDKTSSQLDRKETVRTVAENIANIFMSMVPEDRYCLLVPSGSSCDDTDGLDETNCTWLVPEGEGWPTQKLTTCPNFSWVYDWAHRDPFGSDPTTDINPFIKDIDIKICIPNINATTGVADYDDCQELPSNFTDFARTDVMVSVKIKYNGTLKKDSTLIFSKVYFGK